MSYGGIGQYPPAWWVPAAADAMLYITQDERLFDNDVSQPWSIEHIPGDGDKWAKANPHQGENHPFDIRHLPGEIRKPQDSPLPDNTVPFKNFIKLVTKTTVISPKASYLPD